MNMDTLIAIGTTTAWAYSTLVVFLPGLVPSHDVYFDSAAMILALILVGKLLEEIARGRASEAVRRLLDLQPPVARLLREDGAEEEAPAKLDSAILFAPVGWLVPRALAAMDRGGVLALAGIYMTQIPPLDYQAHLYYERTVRSVTAATRQDGRELLELAERIPIRTQVQCFDLEQANAALQLVKEGRIDGAAVLTCA